MTKSITALCIITLVGIGTAASAQYPPTAKPGTVKDDITQKATTKAGEMTVSGCVAQGKGEGQFMLTNTTMGSKMDTATMPSETKGAHVMSYELVGGTNLKAHVGHKVEVTGTMSKMDADRMAKMDADRMAKTGTMAKDKMPSDHDMQATKLNVASVKMVSATCP